jgi:hypothetical protein
MPPVYLWLILAHGSSADDGAAWDIKSELQTVQLEEQQEELKAAVASVATVDATSVSFIVRSQRGPRDIHFANKLRESLRSQGVPALHIHLLHEKDNAIGDDNPPKGYWNILSYLYTLYTGGGVTSSVSQTPWYCFCEPNTLVNVERLVIRLGYYDSAKVLFVGKSIKTIGSITTDYAFDKVFPFAPSGFVMSTGLINAFGQSVEKKECVGDFTIDAHYELSKVALFQIIICAPTHCYIV